MMTRIVGLRRAATGCCVALLFAMRAPAQGFLIRIGDDDGFGYGAALGFKAANGGPANADGMGVLGNGDFLPDINEGGRVRDEGADEFDFRNAEELANAAIEVIGNVTDYSGTIGSNFTDISLNRNFDNRSGNGQILIGGNPNTGLVRGPGGPFPSPPSSTLPNQPGFLFDFEVDSGAVDTDSSIFFNLIFADYDVVPAEIQITRADNSTLTLDLRRQRRNGNENGLIQAATVTLAFGDVFTVNGALYHGFLEVDFVAPNEPYTAFDYVELSEIPLFEGPEPSSLLIFAIGLTMCCVSVRRRAIGQAECPNLQWAHPK